MIRRCVGGRHTFQWIFKVGSCSGVVKIGCLPSTRDVEEGRVWSTDASSVLYWIAVGRETLLSRSGYQHCNGMFLYIAATVKSKTGQASKLEILSNSMTD